MILAPSMSPENVDERKDNKHSLPQLSAGDKREGKRKLYKGDLNKIPVQMNRDLYFMNCLNSNS